MKRTVHDHAQGRPNVFTVKIGRGRVTIGQKGEQQVVSISAYDKKFMSYRPIRYRIVSRTAIVY